MNVNKGDGFWIEKVCIKLKFMKSSRLAASIGGSGVGRRGNIRLVGYTTYINIVIF